MRVGLCLLTGDKTKVGVVDIEVQQRCRSWSLIRSLELRIRMIENILGVHPELKRLGLCDLDRFRQAGIKSPTARAFNHTLAQRTARSRKRILKKNLSSLCIS